MKKNIFTIVVFLILVGIVVGNSNIVTAQSARESKDNITVEDISKKLIRFHVIANSDGEVDQNLKLKVRDEVLKYIQPILKNSPSIEASRKLIEDKDYEILKIAEKVIKENGYNYKVESTLSKEYFPIKTYGNITLPQGKYEAYRIIIGDGQGQNWWCVMFPPICFVDITKGEVAYEETEKEMQGVLNEDEFKLINNKNENKEDNIDIGVIDNTEENNIVVKFKLGELFKKLMK